MNNKTEIKRDKKGHFLKGYSPNPHGMADPRVVAIRKKLREKLPEVVDELFDAVKSTDGKMKVMAIRTWLEHSIPKLKGHDISECSPESRQKLIEIGKLPVEDQPSALLQLYFSGGISEYVLTTVSSTLSLAQQVKDNAIDMLLAKKELESNDNGD